MEHTKMMSRLLVLATAGAIVIGLNLSVSAAQSAIPQRIEVPTVPAALEVPSGNEVYLQGHAVGTQNYICLPATPGFKWTFTGPQATLFLSLGDELQQQIATHFLSANPLEGNTARPTWQQSADSSQVWGRVRASSTDAAYVQAGAIPWLLLDAAGTAAGPTEGSFFAQTTFIQRVNTSGGIAPSSGCGQAKEVGAVALVPYSTDYLFYRSTNRR
jgi:hypothetical protein